MSDTTAAAPYSHPVDVRFLEVDQQGVVFNMWYLAYVDDALTGYLHANGLPYLEMIGGGHDLQMVHAEVDWSGPLSFGARVLVDVGLAGTGRTSFTLQFRFRVGDREAARASIVYVCVATDGTGKRAIPTAVADALGPVAPLWEDGS